MTEQALRNYSELYNYLVELSELLRAKAEFTLADSVERASKFAVGSPTEFLGEAEEALRSVHASCGSALSEVEFKKVSNVIEQIEIAFRES